MKSCTPRGITSSKEKVSNSDIFFFYVQQATAIHTKEREREKDSERTQEIRKKNKLQVLLRNITGLVHNNIALMVIRYSEKKKSCPSKPARDRAV